MSVTFLVVQEPTAFSLQCSCGDASHSETFSSYVDAVVAHATVNVACGDDFCSAFPASIVAVLPYAEDVNVSNINARAILEVLGLDSTDLCGDLQAEDFLGRILVAQALNPVDAGVPAYADGSVVNCGRPEGYMDSQLIRLQAIAEHAAKHDQLIAWG